MKPLDYRPPTCPLDVLHEDASLLVVNKPSGLLSVPGKAAEHADCLETRLKAAYPEALLVHRLDMDTSGVMVFARTRIAQRHLGLQFERRHLSKAYVARVWGEVEGENGEIDLPLTSDWPNRPLQKVCHETGKPSLTRWRVIEREEGVTRLELTPLTGRTHQLRIHLNTIGHPILGDVFYAPPKIATAADRLQLHAQSLTLRHPDGGAPATFTAPDPF